MEDNKINIEGLRRLSGNDESFVTEVLKLYIDRATIDLNEIKAARASNNWATVRFVVHRMRSAAVPLGLKNLVVLLKKVEMKLKESEQNTVEVELNAIQEYTTLAIDDARHQISVASS